MPKLTDLTLKNLPIPACGQVTYRDEVSPLSVRVSQGGGKTFFVTLDGSGRRHTLGRYGEITLAQAREAARLLRAQKTLGRIIPRSVSFGEARREYLDGISVRANTKTYYERNLERLRASKLQDITPRDINLILDSLGPTSRAQALRSYTAFFNWCIRRHYLDTSPCARMEAGQSTSRSRVLTDHEIKSLWTATQTMGGHFGAIVQLLLLTGQRRGEIAALRADYISNDTCTLPKELTKNARSHTFPLGTLATALLKEAPSFGLVFPARGKPKTPFNGWSKSKAALDALSGVTNWTLHDLRRTYATNLAKLGVPVHVVEKLLNHVSGKPAHGV
jgi:integrase